MRNCPSCKMRIYGDVEYCPLCQNELAGDAGELYYPKRKMHKKSSFIYKLQYFLCLSLMVISLALDFIININNGLHWSLFVVIWVIGGQLCASSIIKRHRNPTQVITKSAVWLILLVTPTLLILGFKDMYLFYVLPGILIIMLILNFIFAMIDKAQNAMAYILTNCLVNTILSVVFIFVFRENDIIWAACLTVCIIVVMALIIFRGRKAGREIQRRFNM